MHMMSRYRSLALFCFFNKQISEKYGKKCCRYNQNGQPLPSKRPRKSTPHSKTFSQVGSCAKTDIKYFDNPSRWAYSSSNKLRVVSVHLLAISCVEIDSTLVVPKLFELTLQRGTNRFDAPDRQAAKISYEELRSLNPSRQFNLILLNKTIDDIQKVKKELIKNIYPKTTHMDFNIATALHMVSAGTSTKICASGLGANEIFADYSSYRITYKRAGYDQMENEMIFAMERLWIRNLGRDDRAISMNAKEARYPFLYLSL